MSAPSLSDFTTLTRELFVVADVSGHMTWVSQGWTELLGWSTEELVAGTFDRFLHPDDIDRTRLAFERLVQEGVVERALRNRFRTTDGRWLWLEWSVGVGEDGRFFGVAREVSAQVQTRNQLEQELASMRLAEELAAVGRWHWDLRSDTLTWSGQMYALHGLDPDTFTPTLDAAGETCHPDDCSLHRDAVAKGLRGEPFELRCRKVRPDGTVRQVRARGVPQRDASGQVVAMYGVSQDITDLIDARQVAAESSSALDLLLQHGPLVLWRCGPDEVFTEYRGNGLARFGLPPDALVGATIDQIYPDRPEEAALVRGALAGEAGSFHSSGTTEEGVSFRFTTVVSPDPARPGHAVGLAFDVTDAWDARRRLETAFEASGAALWEWDVAGGRITWSPHMAALVGISESGQHPLSEWVERVHPDDQDAMVAAYRAHATGEAPYSMEYRLRTGPGRDGPYIWVRVTGQVIRDRTGAPVRMIGSMEDVSAQRRTVEALRSALDRSEAAHRARSQFIANVSHEIRTPLNGILGLAQILRDLDETTERQVAYLDDMLASSHILLRLIDDVLDVARQEAGVLELRETAFGLRALLTEQARLHAGPAAAKGVALAVDLEDESVSDMVSGDPVRLAQVVGNLLGNAVKFTEVGQVTLRGELRPDGDRLQVRITVQDTGPGIPEADRERIFRVFEQVDPSVTRRHGGAGLGLAISSELIQAMGGSLSLESPEEGGSRFVIALTLPRGQANTRSDWAGDDDSLGDAHVLLVEDNPINRKVALLMLERLGCQVTAVADGASGVRAVAEHNPDLVLMDVQMPVMDGLTATRTLRQSGVTLPIIGLTAHAGASDRKACLDAGMDDQITKPVSMETLKAALLEHLPSPGLPTGSPDRPGRGSAEG